jgi:hypothetical protein
MSITVAIRSGRWVIVLIVCFQGMIALGSEPTLQLQLGDRSDWAFRGGDAWHEAADGEIRSFRYTDKKSYQSQGKLYRPAFYTAASYGDMVADFDFFPDYRQNGHGTAGMIVRAGDAAHYYIVYFPWGGQQMRAKNFWAAIGKVDGDGYIHNIKMAIVPGVPSETERWYHARVEVAGNTISVSVNGRKALEVTDDTYSSGYVGLAGHGFYAFRNIRITGKRIPSPAWNDSVTMSQRRLEIPTTAGRKDIGVKVAFNSQYMPSLLALPNGDVLLVSAHCMLRSKDGGRTWGEIELLPKKLGAITDYGDTMFSTNKGRLIVQHFRSRKLLEAPLPKVGISESNDHGRTWSDIAWSKLNGDWAAGPQNLQPYGPLVETADGTLVRFVMSGGERHGAEVGTWGAVHCSAYALRSTDRGASWSAPIELDRPYSFTKQRGFAPGSVDFTECTGVAIGDTITVLVRPIYSAQMWQCWSDDAGATWDSATRATFAGYAQSMIRLKSGPIVVAHRYPQYSINVSRDDGLNWDQGTIIDSPAWAMGAMIEVEPDVVLCVYMNEPRELPLLAQRIRITPNGITPAD